MPARPTAGTPSVSCKFQDLPNVVILHNDVALGVDDFGAEGEEERADGIDGVAGLAETDAEGNAALVTSLGRLQECIGGPASAFGASPAGYIACTSMPACFFIKSMREQGPLIWLPTQAGTPSHLSPDLPR